jgi:P4 family phage/plasmid primase-like protien
LVTGPNRLTLPLAIARRGWSVFPVYEITRKGKCACRKRRNDAGHKPGKHPRTRRGVKDATTSEETIRSWVARWPRTNIGIATGAPSGFIVLDIDPRNGSADSLAALTEKYGPLPATVQVRTGSGGRHLYFAHPADRKVANRTNLGGFRGLDLKGDGGYVVAPSSNHVSGGSYEWVPGHGPDDVPLAPYPGFLLDLAGTNGGKGPVSYKAIPWDGTLPDQVRDVIDRDPHVRARFQRDSKGLSDRSDSGVDQSLASLLARNGVPAADIEGGIRASRAAAGLGARPDTYYRATVGKALAAAKAPAAPSVAANPNPAQFFTPRGRFIVERAARLVQRRGHVRSGIDGRLYRYVNGVYRPDGESFAQVQTRELLRDRWTKHRGTEVVAWLQAFEPTLSATPPLDELNVANGILNWRTVELRPHTPEFLSTIQLPVAWAPEAQCPRIDQFLREVLPGDAIEFIFEVIGLALYAANPMRVAILLHGPGRNGKSVLLSVITGLLGEENVSSVPLQALSENRFRPAELFGKLANICGDLDARAVKQTDVLKQITGGDMIQAERKYGHPFQFKSFALPLFSANEPPMSADQSQAWFDRWIVIPMDRRIPDNEQDTGLPAKLTTKEELEGMLQRSVAGLRRLMERGRFELPPSVQRACAQYREGLDTIAAFLAEECSVEETAWTSRPQLHAAYRRWCRETDRPPVSAQRFNDELPKRLGSRVAPRTRTGRRGWSGIRLAG